MEVAVVGPAAEPSALVVPLDQAAGLGLGTDRIGSKAANLARLAAAGFPVPAGLVIPTDAFARWPELQAALPEAARSLGEGSLAVRSSAAAEDLAGASYAGLYETFLDVDRDQLAEAVRRCWESTSSQRVTAYQHHRQQAPDGSAGPEPPGMAVLVQRRIHPNAAGVAFTANPVSGARDEVVVTAVRGLGERLVSGEATGDQWIIRGGRASCVRAVEQAITAEQSGAVATLARRVQEQFGAPQDVEWAITDNTLWLLQARPMTALPDPVDWTPPARGYWMRNFRLGEWLPEPMTPLFADWLLERLERGYLQATRRHVGAALVFPHAAINGWYYTATPTPSPRTLLPALLSGRGRLVRFMRYGVLGPARDPVTADRRLLARLGEEWDQKLLPRYQQAVQAGQQHVDRADPQQLAAIVNSVGALAGEYLWSLSVVGGSAWKMEGVLASFYRQHLAASVPGSVQQLLVGLPGTEPDVPAHAVQSVDWYHPTAGELGWQPPQPASRHRDLAAHREQLTAQCTAALARTPQLQARFLTLLAVAQRYAALRERQARQFTLAWPLLRRCALRLDERLHANATIDQAEDIFFLTCAELDSSSPLHGVVGERRAVWERQRRLLAPLTIGRPPRLVEKELLATVDAVRSGGPPPEGAIVGQPASPGRATGPVRIVRGPADFDRFQAGEVLVAQATAPAWTPLFARAAAVVTDGGTLAAHASLVAREYGIPAVVATGDATTRLADGQIVLVDGSAGTVQPRH
jgi:phosphohistidine swiveling domain-containing protein